MSGNAYLTAVVIGAALTGLWLSVRFARLTPKSGAGAAACLALAWVVPGLAVPLLAAAVARLPLGLAVLATVFPVLVVTFALTALGLRYLAALAGHAIR